MAALWGVLFEALNILQTLKMIAVKIVKWITAWKKYILLVQDRKSVTGFVLPANFESDGMTDIT